MTSISIPLAHRVSLIKPSPTLAITAKAAELRAAGQDIISLSAGEPDFDTPEHIKQAAIQALHQGKTKYTAVEGIPELKSAICEKFKKDNQLEYKPNQILVSCGAKHSLYNLTQALVDDGDEVIIPAPYWVSYPDLVLLAGGKPVVIETTVAQQFKITPEQLEKSITKKTKLVVFNSPSNPTGVAYSKRELKALADVLEKHPHVYIVTDDIYEHILWSDEPFTNILNVAPSLYDRTIVVNGVSKGYSMTGWRIGYAAGPTALISAMGKLQSQSTSNPTSIAQYATVAALNGPQACVADMCKAFKRRHDFVVPALQAIPGLKCTPSDGTFYTFPDASGAIERLQSMQGIKDDIQLSAYLLEKAKIAVVPGSAFGAPGCFRISYATSDELLHKALDRLIDALK